MYPRTRYLEWAIANGGSCKFDLATSGISPAAARANVDVAAARIDDPNGWENLRTTIARANGFASRNAVAALGTSHAVWLAYASTLSPGDEILIESPAYEPLVNAALGIGANVKRFDRPQNTGFQLDPEIVRAALSPRTKVVVVSNLHNPSGARTSNETLAAVASIAAKSGATLIVDEVYAPFDELCDRDGIWRGSAVRLGENVVAVSSLTKCYGLGPHRIGWLLGPPEVIANAEAVLLATCGSLPLAHANLALRAFEALPTLAEHSRRTLAEKRARVSSWVTSRSDLEWHAPTSGLFGFVTVKRRPSNVRAVIERGMRERDVMVVPGEFFELPHGFRIAWSLDASLLDEGLERLGHVVDQM